MSEGAPEGWETTTLGELGEFSTSSVDKKLNSSELPVRLINYMDVYRSRYLDSAMNLMSVTATRAEVEKSQVRSGDMFFTPSSETPDDIGHSAVLVDEAPGTLHSYHTVRLRIHPSRNVDNRFRGRLANAKSVLKHFSISATGSTRYTLSLGDFRSAPVNLPPVEEQTKIAQVLDTLDTTIAQTEAIIAKLKAVKQGLLHDLLTRGIDANGELRPPQSEAPQLYKQSAVGWIPKEWETRSIGELLADVTPAMRSGPFGSELLKHELVESGFPLLGIDNVFAEKFVSDYRRFVTRNKFNSLSRYAVRPNDLMITIMGTVGRCCLVPEGIGKALSSKHTWTITLDPEKYSAYLAMLQVNHSPWVLRHFAKDAQGGTMSAIRSDTLRSTLLPRPPRDEQEIFEARLRAVASRIEIEVEDVEKLVLQKRGLMDDLLTGRVRVTPLLETAAA